MPTAAIYARFSSDLQRDRSIEDQVALCRTHAARSGFDVVACFEDRARSGSSVIGRDGIMRLLEAARERKFDVVVVEALDRLSRDQEDLAGIFKRLTFAGVKIVAVHDGVADPMQVGIRGLVGALYLTDLAHKVRRGMSGVIRDGRSAGGRAYGYRPVPGRAGELEIVEPEAEVIRRIFAVYAAGRRPRDIAGDLNREGVPPPRGRFWTAATINGNRQRGHGILLNPIYAGRLIWNRIRMVKDPDTGRRVSRINPETEWQHAEAPHLRIIGSDLFDAVQAMKAATYSERPQDRRKPKHLLSGLLKCAVCGGGMSVKDRDHGRVRILCTQAKEAGSCENRRPYYLDAVERAVVEGLKEKLRDRPAIEVFIRSYNAERKRLAADAAGNRSRIEARIGQAERAYDRAYNGYLQGFISEQEASTSIPALRAERDRVRAELLACDEPPRVLQLHPEAIKRYLASINRLDLTLAQTAVDGDEEPRQALRDLVDRVVVKPPDADRIVTVEVHGHLSRLLGEDVFPSLLVRGGSMVAGEGLEPPTRGL